MSSIEASQAGGSDPPIHAPAAASASAGHHTPATPSAVLAWIGRTLDAGQVQATTMDPDGNMRVLTTQERVSLLITTQHRLSATVNWAQHHGVTLSLLAARTVMDALARVPRSQRSGLIAQMRQTLDQCSGPGGGQPDEPAHVLLSTPQTR